MADNDQAPQDQAPEPSEGTKLRNQLNQTLAENKVLRDTIVDATFAQAGVDITKGRGKTARTHYEGEPSLEAVRKYLTEDYEMDLSGSSTAATPVAQLGNSIGEHQARIESVVSGGGSLTAATLDQEIAQAEAAGEWAQAISLKTKKLGLSI